MYTVLGKVMGKAKFFNFQLYLIRYPIKNYRRAKNSFCFLRILALILLHIIV